jgi:hypothetical protein
MIKKILNELFAIELLPVQHRQHRLPCPLHHLHKHHYHHHPLHYRHFLYWLLLPLHRRYHRLLLFLRLLRQQRLSLLRLLNQPHHHRQVIEALPLLLILPYRRHKPDRRCLLRSNQCRLRRWCCSQLP